MPLVSRQRRFTSGSIHAILSNHGTIFRTKYFYKDFTAEQKESLRPYFTRGLRPSEALEPIKEDGLDIPDMV